MAVRNNDTLHPLVPRCRGRESKRPPPDRAAGELAAQGRAEEEEIFPKVTEDRGESAEQGARAPECIVQERASRRVSWAAAGGGGRGSHGWPASAIGSSCLVLAVTYVRKSHHSTSCPHATVTSLACLLGLMYIMG